MKTIFTLTAFIALSFISFAQDYSYSFNGSLNDNQYSSLLGKLESNSHISNPKIKYKDDKKGGEIWFDINVSASKSDVENEFSPIEIKSTLISFGLEPLVFKSRPKNH